MRLEPSKRRSSTGTRRAAAQALSALLIPLTKGCAGPQSALDPAGPQAGRITSLWWLMFWVCLAIFVIVSAFTLLAAFRRRPEKNHTVSPDGEKNLTRAVAAAVGATVIILFVFLVVSYRVGRRISSPAGADAITIKVTGNQWWWKIEYEDPVPSNMVTTANEIHIPVGRPVQFKLTSRDVIHSFWVPNLHGKRDLIPGHEATLWLQADREGIYRGQCAEFCGHQHAHMAFAVIAEPAAAFEA
jgi:cytochrome c oxidase subunit 2